ncbi:bifunctional UDP-sugar hydrolase/5'-nucleotidase [Mollicutes bacterium LVI A0078]|nr:bifunctional UDP-sugar hydrolase/5'-nucleotidase [Mollicutes bacterium LVI A0075]WOO90603.1 bifunctional UDP-sugar hydrolase/5'-nucleotidase [Mollicutes bacterium LVI A0078]
MKILKLFQTSDIHGNIFPTNYVEARNHGLAKVSTLIKTNSKDSDHTLILDSGDVLQGNSLAFYTEKHKVTEPSIIDAFNLIGYDGITLGNHEFNYGLDYLTKHYTKFNNPVLCANITGLPFEAKPYQLYTYDDLTIAVIGLTTNFIPNWEQPANIEGLEFKCPVETYKLYEQEMTNKADIIIVNYHGGFECDIETAQTLTEPDTKENVGSHLINSFSSIDIMLTGHQHRTIATKTKGVVCMQPGCNGGQVSEITIDVESKKIVDYKLTSVQNFEPDTEILDYFNSLNQDCNKYLDTTLCKLDKDISVTDVSSARLNGHPFLSFLGQAFTSYMEADFVALSLFDTAIGFKEDVTIRQVNQNYPFPNTIMKIEITGSQMIEAIKQACFYYTLKDGEIDIHRSYISPKLKHYNYDMYYGLEYRVQVTDTENIVTDVKVKGNDIALDKTYTMLVSNYRYNNRGDYPVYNDVKLLSESQDDAIEILLNYLSNSDTITIEDTINYTITK